MKVSGIIIRSTVQSERNMIVELILGHGFKLPVYIYGGQGGGSKKKVNQLFLGTYAEFVLSEKKGGQSGTKKHLSSCREWKVLWAPKSIRNCHHSFFAWSFLIEIAALFAQDSFELIDNNQDACQEFSVLSNGLYFLDQYAASKDQSRPTNMHYARAIIFMYLAKILWSQGIFPAGEREVPAHLLSVLKTYVSTSFTEISSLPHVSFHDVQLVIHYLCQSFQISPATLRSLDFLS